jgi:hypothetical protein
MFVTQYINIHGVHQLQQQQVAQQRAHLHVIQRTKEVLMYHLVQQITIIIGVIHQAQLQVVQQQAHLDVNQEIKDQVMFQVVHRLNTHVVIADILR